MTEIICGRCGEKFTSETENDSDEYCPACLKEMTLEAPIIDKQEEILKRLKNAKFEGF